MPILDSQPCCLDLKAMNHIQGRGQSVGYLRVVRHYDVLLNVRLWGRNLELYEADLGIFNPRRAPSRPAGLLIEHQAIDKLRVVDLHGQQYIFGG